MQPKKISLFFLALLVVASIDSIRNLPSAALFGPQLIFFYLFAAVTFLFPTALVSGEFSSSFPEKGGIYHWVRHVFNDRIGMLAVWFQWINTITWYPTILSFIGGTFAALIDPSLATNKTFLITVILVVFWSLTFLNLFGIRVSGRINAIFALIGTIIPMGLMIGLGFLWMAQGNPLQVTFSWNNIIPSMGNWNGWISLTGIMASLLGMELSGVHVNDVVNPKRNYPRAIAWAVGIILITLIFGSLAIAIVIPQAQINLLDGVIIAFGNFLTAFDLGWSIPFLGALMILGSFGSMINWIIAPAKGLLQAAEHGFLSPYFAKPNRYGVAPHVLIGQALLVSLLCIVYYLFPTVNAFYWFLTDLSTELYMGMYILLFLAAWRFRPQPGAFCLPGKLWGRRLICSLGLTGCLATLIVGYFPPASVDVGSHTRYALMIAIGNLALLSPILLFWRYHARHRTR